jgi:GAF domain-containing protein/HAMP domain-containing protein
VARVDNNLLNQVKQGNRYISPIYIDDLSSEPIVILAVPVADIFGDFQGTLLAEVNLKFMWDLVDNLDIGLTGQAYVVDRQGNLIAFRDNARVLRRENVAHLREVAEFVNNPALVDETGADISRGIDENETFTLDSYIVGTYVPLGIPDWAVVTELPIREAYQEVIQGVGLSVAFIVILAILAGGVGIVLARRLAIPLRNLTEISSRIAGGEFDLEASVEGPTEVTQLAGAFNSMTANLHELIDSLEERVADRTERLEILATLNERLSAILDFEQLLVELVNQVRDRFGYYHAHVYILDENSQNLVMTAGAGRAGAEMKARGHQISLNAASSLVARAARTGDIVWVDNVREAEDWLPNQFLPDTYAEMAVPIILEGQVVGVLDVQEDEVGGLDESDATLLRSLANQVAIAIRNARLFAEVETALASARAAQEQYVGDAWAKVKSDQQGAVYQYHRPGTKLLDNTVIAQLEQEAATQDKTTVVTINSESLKPEQIELNSGNEEINDAEDSTSEIQKPTAVVAPIRLQDQTIGTINLVETENQREWSDLELLLVQTVADQVAQAAENLRLFEETRQRAGREQTIRQVTENMRSATNLEELMQIAAKELGEQLSADYAVVELGVKDKKSEGNGRNLDS